MTTSDNNAAAWNFVLANMSRIQGFCARIRGCQDEDFVQECIADIVSKFHTWDSERSPTGSTFVWWRIRRVHTRTAIALSKTPIPLGEGIGHQRTSGGGAIDPPHSSINDLADRSGMIDSFQHVQLKEALDAATDGQRDAALIIAEGLSGDEVMERFGVTRQSAINRIGRLASKLSEDGDDNDN
jgi:DNA-directed RNA polymerase specialized sigma24 family protein